MDESPEELVRRIHREAAERLGPLPTAPEPPTIPYTELLVAQPGDLLYAEWNTYRREAPRLLADGQEGRFALIQGEVIVGIFDTREEARAVGEHRFPTTRCLVKPIRTREPLVRVLGRLIAWPF